MKQYQFKTNINCGGCVATAKPFLDNKSGISSWKVDTQHPSKILTVETELNETEIRELVKSAGFKAELITSS
jgi:copper chaperone CopZ